MIPENSQCSDILQLCCRHPDFVDLPITRTRCDASIESNPEDEVTKDDSNPVDPIQDPDCEGDGCTDYEDFTEDDITETEDDVNTNSHENDFSSEFKPRCGRRNKNGVGVAINRQVAHVQLIQVDLNCKQTGVTF